MMRRLIAVSCLVLVMLPRFAVAESISYTIQDVKVSASAADATTARVTAMTQAESEAFKRLLAQLLTPEEAAARAATAQEYQISRMVRGYEVKDEKVGSTSYAATLNVAFDQKQVEAFLRPPAIGSGAAVAGQPPVAGTLTPPAPVAASQPVMRANVLVLPVWTAEGKSLLWEEGNLWRNAWNKAERTDTQFIRLPVGDQSDSMVMDAAQAKQAPYASFSPIAERYQAATVVVADASPSVVSGVNILAVQLRSLGMQGQTSALDLKYEQTPEESPEQLMQRAAQDVIKRIMQEGQVQTLEQVEAQAPHNKLTVLSRINKLNDWVMLRKRLTELPAVEQVELSAISSQQADMVIHFRGSPTQLENAMAAQGLKVSKAYNYWVVGF